MIGLLIGSLIAYLTGSIPFSQLAASIKGVDLTKSWDGNVGITNVIKTTKSLWLTLFAIIGDLSKGMFSILMAYNIHDYFNENLNTVLILMSFFVVVGHVFSIFLKFKGGIGQLTSFGTILFINPVLAVLIYISRYLERPLAYLIYDVKDNKSRFYANNISAIIIVFILYVLVFMYDTPRISRLVFIGATSGLLLGYLKRYYYIKKDLLPILKRKRRDKR